MNKIAKVEPDTPTRRTITKKTRAAIVAMYTKGITAREAAKLVDMRESSLSRARKQEHVKAYEEEVKSVAAHEVAHLDGLAKQQATRVGLDLMHNAKSEAVRARMVELFADRGKPATQINVQTTVNTGGNGYEFVPPGAQIIDITPEGETQDVVSEGSDQSPNDTETS